MRAASHPIIVLALAAALLLGGCAALGDLADRAGLAGPTDTELLAAVSLTAQDTAPGAELRELEGGDEVAGRRSLDLCFGSFPSEDLRVGRRQVGIGDDGPTVWISSEAILYGTVEQAEQAMAELARARQECPDEPVGSLAAGQPALTWTFADPPDADWPQDPGVARQAYAFEVADAAGGMRSATATYLQRGRMILAVYSTPPDGAQQVLRNAPDPARVTTVMTQRLLTLPERALQRPAVTPPPSDDLSA